ncbi:MAG: hypothetical protein EHM19_04465 [Candidatus Latescibacterota bacterium]|nr:MAG: hypothetical protein EHM19_04465 [Candidatus Latescibacterota bacterium]
MIPRASLARSLAALLFLALGAAEARASAGHHGPIVRAPDGSRVVVWQRGVVSELPFVKDRSIPRTDTIPEPIALAVDWKRRLIAVAPRDLPPRIDLYKEGDRSPFASIAGLRAPAALLEADAAGLTVAGAGYLEKRALPEGTLLDSLRWDPPVPPVDVCCSEQGTTLLLGDRLIHIGDGAVFRPLGALGEPVSLAGTGAAGAEGREGAAGLFFLSEGILRLALPGGEEMVIAELAPGERPLGAAYSPASGLVLLPIAPPPGERAGGAATRPPGGRGKGPPGARGFPRIELRDAGSGALVQQFRSARLAGMADKEGEFENPLAAALDPTGRYVAVSWRLTGTQIWDSQGWKLVASYYR